MPAAAARQALSWLCLGILLSARLSAAADTAVPGLVPKVLILGIDGLRADAFRAAAAPHLLGLAHSGSFAPDAYADRVTRSGPGWTSLLTGAWSPKHGVTDNTFAGHDPERFPHVFRRIKEARPGMVTAALVAWEPLSRLATHADISRAYMDDDSVARAAERLLSGREGPDPDVLFLHFDAPDFAGHRYGFSRFSPPYMAAIRRTDERAGRVLAALATRPGREREAWLIVMATDHGGVLRHHGEDVPACRRVPLIASGDVEVAAGRLAGAGLADVAPTVLGHLGLAVDPRWDLDGRVLPLAPLGRVVRDRLSRQLPDLAEEEIR